MDNLDILINRFFPSDGVIKCPTHGHQPAVIQRVNRESVCKVCFLERFDNAEARDKKIEEEYKEKIRREKIGVLRDRSGIPERYKNIGFLDYEIRSPGQKVALNKAQTYSENWLKNRINGIPLIFSGGVGTGKTHLAISIAHYVIHKYLAKVYYTTFIDLLDDIKDGWKDTNPTHKSAFDRAVSVDLLILDEISNAYRTHAEMVQLQKIIDCRYREKRPTLLITNISALSDEQVRRDMKALLGEPTYDRFKEGDMVVFSWKSHRGQPLACAV